MKLLTSEQPFLLSSISFSLLKISRRESRCLSKYIGEKSPLSCCVTSSGASSCVLEGVKMLCPDTAHVYSCRDGFTAFIRDRLCSIERCASNRKRNFGRTADIGTAENLEQQLFEEIASSFERFRVLPLPKIYRPNYPTIIRPVNFIQNKVLSRITKFADFPNQSTMTSKLRSS